MIMKYFREIQQLEIVSKMQISGFFFKILENFLTTSAKWVEFTIFLKSFPKFPKILLSSGKNFAGKKTQFLLSECVDCIPPFCELWVEKNIWEMWNTWFSCYYLIY